ncbi:hypothetical protein [Nonomuraea sp. JJY05]|jgi:hypothetical protein|uniref:hypothetical protein n=1 Tax=Nonomuraea sp. JJY05 TaxID=3350255 RepID=UPI00373EA65E
MKSMTKALLTGSALACLTLAGTTGTAHAATGRLTLFSGTAGVSFVYGTCQPPRDYPVELFQVDTFDNQPVPGCQAVLTGRSGASQVLCVGRGSVPPELRQVLRVRIQPGTAPPCAYGPAAGN